MESLYEMEEYGRGVSKMLLRPTQIAGSSKITTSLAILSTSRRTYSKLRELITKDGEKKLEACEVFGECKVSEVCRDT